MNERQYQFFLGLTCGVIIMMGVLVPMMVVLYHTTYQAACVVLGGI